MADVDILQALITEVGADLNRRLDSQDRQLTDIAVETRKTNGRVTALEAEAAAAAKVATALLAREVKEQDEARDKTSYRRWLIPLLVAAALAAPGWGAALYQWIDALGH